LTQEEIDNLKKRVLAIIKSSGYSESPLQEFGDGEGKGAEARPASGLSHCVNLAIELDKASHGDLVIIAAFGMVHEDKLDEAVPKLVFPDAANRIVETRSVPAGPDLRVRSCTTRPRATENGAVTYEETCTVGGEEVRDEGLRIRLGGED